MEPIDPFFCKRGSGSLRLRCCSRMMESAWIDGRLDWLGDWPGPDALFLDAVERGLAQAFLDRDVSQLFFVGLFCPVWEDSTVKGSAMGIGLVPTGLWG